MLRMDGVLMFRDAEITLQRCSQLLLGVDRDVQTTSGLELSQALVFVTTGRHE